MNTSYKESRRHVRRCVLLLASVIGIGLLVFTAVFCSTAGEGEIVRIGWFDSPFYYYDEAGRCTGYAYDYQEKIAAYTGWKYGYVEGSWPELLEKLKAGEIDVLCDVSYSADREGKMLFSTLPMGTETYYLFVRADDSKASSGDVSVLNGQRVGVNKDSVQEDYLREWAETNGLDIDIVELTESEEHSVNLLKRGKIRALVTLDAYGEEDSYVPVAKIGQSDFFFAVNKDHPELLKELNAAMSRIQDEDRYYDQELFEKYIQRSGANAFLSAGA